MKRSLSCLTLLIHLLSLNRQNTIRAKWEISEDDTTWKVDFYLTYIRAHVQKA